MSDQLIKSDHLMKSFKFFLKIPFNVTKPLPFLYLAKSLLFMVYGLLSASSFLPLVLLVSCWKSNFLAGVIPKGSIKRSPSLSLTSH